MTASDENHYLAYSAVLALAYDNMACTVALAS